MSISLLSRKYLLRRLERRYRCLSIAANVVRNTLARHHLYTFPHQQDTDVVVVSYPCSGRTWLWAMLGMTVAADTELRESVFDNLRYGDSPRWPSIGFTHDGANLVLRSHFTRTSFDKRQYRDKVVVYLHRDPRDVLVSSFFHHTVRQPCFQGRTYEGTLPEFIRDGRFGIEKVLAFAHSWARNVAVPKKFILLRYEDLHSHPVEGLQHLLSSIGATADVTHLRSVVAACSFRKMREIERAGSFYTQLHRADADNPNSYKTRRGEVGTYAEYFSEDDLRFLHDTLRRVGDPFCGPGSDASAGAGRAMSSWTKPLPRSLERKSVDTG